MQVFPYSLGPYQIHFYIGMCVQIELWLLQNVNLSPQIQKFILGWYHCTVYCPLIASGLLNPGTTGINLGIAAIHPFTGQSIPVFAADYVVTEYGTKAVMGVPGHDARDELLAEEHQLPVTTVNESLDGGERILKNSDKVCDYVVAEKSEAFVYTYVLV